jgi:hypothetical protein
MELPPAIAAQQALNLQKTQQTFIKQAAETGQQVANLVEQGAKNATQAANNQTSSLAPSGGRGSNVDILV